MKAVADTVNFEALDSCHQQISSHLNDLAELARHVAANGVDAKAQQLGMAQDVAGKNG